MLDSVFSSWQGPIIDNSLRESITYYSVKVACKPLRLVDLLRTLFSKRFYFHYTIISISHEAQNAQRLVLQFLLNKCLFSRQGPVLDAEDTRISENLVSALPVLKAK